ERPAYSEVDRVLRDWPALMHVVDAGQQQAWVLVAFAACVAAAVIVRLGERDADAVAVLAPAILTLGRTAARVHVHATGRLHSPLAVLDAQIDAAAVVERVAVLLGEQGEQLDRAVVADHDLVAEAVHGHSGMEHHPR